MGKWAKSPQTRINTEFFVPTLLFQNRAFAHFLWANLVRTLLKHRVIPLKSGTKTTLPGYAHF